MTKAVGAALVPEILAQSPPAVKVGAGAFIAVGCYWPRLLDLWIKGRQNMNKKSTEEVVKDKFFAFLADTSLSHARRDHIHAGHSYGSNCLLLGWSHQPYSEAIEAVHEALPQVSKRSTGRALSNSMRRLFERQFVREDADVEAEAPVLDSILPKLDSSDVLEEITDFLELLKSQVRPWTAFMFVEGVELKISQLEIGRATLYPKREGPLVPLLEKLKNDSTWECVLQDIERETAHTHCYLTVSIEGEDDFANQEAFRKGQDVINILNLYLASSGHRASFYQTIGIVGQPAMVRGQFVLKCTPRVGQDDDQVQWGYFGQLPPGRCYDIDCGKVQQWKRLGLDAVVASVESANPQARSAQSRIKNSVTWYGTAMNAHTEAEQFVGLMTALESLVVADERVSITQRLKDAVSALLGGDFQTREDNKKRIGDLYELRGCVVHGGEPVAQDNLLELNSIVIQSIFGFVQQECQVR